MKKISYEEFKNSPRLFKISNREIKSDYKKFDVANSIKEEMNKLIGIRE